MGYGWLAQVFLPLFTRCPLRGWVDGVDWVDSGGQRWTLRNVPSLYFAKNLLFLYKNMVGQLLSEWEYTFASENQSFMLYETY